MVPERGAEEAASTADPSLEAAPGRRPAGASDGGGLTLVATPIGNLGDLSPRALAALREADAVLCEDTRVTGGLLARHGVKARLVPLHDHNEESATPGLVARMAAGERLALASDAGTPLVSDPGYRLARAAIAAGVPVTGVPGPSAAVMALTLSGLPPHPFLFLGFLPARAGPRAAECARFAALERAGLRATLVLYEAPHRLGEALAALAEALGPDRPAAVARELTKRFEEVVRGPLGHLARRYASEAPRGEIAVVVGPPSEAALAEAGSASLEGVLRAALASGLSLRDAAATAAEAAGVPRREAYALALALRAEEDGGRDGAEPAADR